MDYVTRRELNLVDATDVGRTGQLHNNKNIVYIFFFTI